MDGIGLSNRSRLLIQEKSNDRTIVSKAREKLANEQGDGKDPVINANMQIYSIHFRDVPHPNLEDMPATFMNCSGF
jgi:hypothetical protein